MKSNWKPNEIAVLGAGAMGSLFGGLLAEGGLAVTLIDVWKEHIDEIKRNGLKITGAGGERCVKLRASTDPSEVGAVDVVLVLTKARYTEKAVKGAISLFKKDTVAISFQNGLGNEDVIGQIAGRENVLGGDGSGIGGSGTRSDPKCRKPAVPHRRARRGNNRSC